MRMDGSLGGGADRQGKLHETSRPLVKWSRLGRGFAQRRIGLPNRRIGTRYFSGTRGKFFNFFHDQLSDFPTWLLGSTCARPQKRSTRVRLRHSACDGHFDPPISIPEETAASSSYVLFRDLIQLNMRGFIATHNVRAS